MPIYRDKTRGCYRFEFNRVIEGRRVRARKYLPKTWTQSQADAFDKQETARLYAVGTAIERVEYSIEDAVNVYILERLPHLKTGDHVARELAQMNWAYTGRPITALADACKFFAAKGVRANEDDKRPFSPASIRNRIRYLTAACRYGWKHHNMCKDDPAARVSVPVVKNERQEYASRRQMLQLSRACTNRPARQAIRIAFYSGLRLSEILRTQVRGQTFYLMDTKNGDPRVVPIHPRILVCVRRFNQKTPKITIQRAFQRARQVCDLVHIHFHDLRHSAASELINAGVDLFTVGRVLGHKDPRSTQRYSHLAIDTLTVAVGKIGRKSA